MHHAHCSVELVRIPGISSEKGSNQLLKYRFTKVLLAIDDSRFSDAAIRMLIEQSWSREIEAAQDLETRVGRRFFDMTSQVTTHVADGDPKTEILDHANEWKADLIVIGSHGRKGLVRFLLGSVSEAVARSACCSVQVVRSSDSKSKA